MKINQAKKTQYVKCPNCGKMEFRTEVISNVDIKIEKGGYIDVGFDFSEGEVNKNYIYCSNCGEELPNKYK